MTYYKVTDNLTSISNKAPIHYEVGEWVYAPSRLRPLFVFEDLAEAHKFAEQVLGELYECEADIILDYPFGEARNTRAGEIMFPVWAECTSDIYCVLAPRSTRAASRVKLTKLIQDYKKLARLLQS